jgi:hypothetical protein
MPGMIFHMTNLLTPTPPTPKPTPIPLVTATARKTLFEMAEEDPRCNPVPDSKFCGGLWRDTETGETFALAVHEENGYFRTHTCKNSAHYWEGTEGEFKQKFERI